MITCFSWCTDIPGPADAPDQTFQTILQDMPDHITRHSGPNTRKNHTAIIQCKNHLVGDW